ncbi:ABC transporter substrate-binding protein [Nocardioides sp. Kera G14]|uniref:ABC transporter substrate-binding protein n=1 Tax=Nocardioides sp. Kera G14 TaxID=2884264 RepID=UPI001D11EF9C|nr:ABC transporter substrate-binding protein [Nocardioides sp. Kera G14]UDY24386.1 ABC transporter substrate-binding protein [Nocardioides sp. Kera G14]
MSLVRPLTRPFVRNISVAATAATLALSLAACGSTKGEAAAAADTDGTTHVKIAVAAGDSYPTATIDVATQEKIRDELPKDLVKSGKLVIGEGALPTGFPPLAFVGDDDTTITGAEPDLGRLVAAVFGLEPEITNATWDNLFVGIDSGKTDVGFSNITDTEKRKEKYDFASYRQDNLGLAVKGDNQLDFTGDPAVLDGLTVAVGAGTNQEKILVEFNDKLKAAGKEGIDIKYYSDNTAIWTALESGQIDAYFGPNPGIAYEEAQTGDKFRTAGTYSGAGASLQGLIAATVKKDSGLAQPVADAINFLIENGQYAEWLKTYNLTNEAVAKSEVNPAGLPLDNS